jgi:hypothetical protein
MAGVVLAFAAASTPLLRRAAVTDPALVPWVVPLSFFRAFAQGLGLALGLVAVRVKDRRGGRSEKARAGR